MKPGEIYTFRIDAGVTSNVFKKGHRVRLEISSSNFPRFDRNSNTGSAVEQAPKLVKASQTVYHDAAHPSCLVLMVIPIAGLFATSIQLSRIKDKPTLSAS